MIDYSFIGDGKLDSEDNNTVTYEAIFEMLRKERNSDSLQKLDEKYYQKVSEYLKNKTSDDKDILINAKKLLKETYERREKKIMTLAIDKCRLGMESANTSNLLKEERFLFNQAVEILQRSRASIIETLLAGNTPSVDVKIPVESPANPEETKKAENESQPEKGFVSADTLSKSSQLSLTVRFLHAVPKFVGKELEVYGPFEQEEIANVPEEIAKILITKGRAEEIKT